MPPPIPEIPARRRPPLLRQAYGAAIAGLLFWLPALGHCQDVRAESQGVSSDSEDAAVSVQELMERKRPPGPILVSIPVALVFGLDGKDSHPYCSPRIRASNSSNKTIDELSLGVEYFIRKTGASVGTTFTTHRKIKVGDLAEHYFYQVPADSCQGLIGKVTVLRCVYLDGSDCRGDVREVGFGTIPLFGK